jgi:hypothetical protein
MNRILYTTHQGQKLEINCWDDRGGTSVALRLSGKTVVTGRWDGGSLWCLGRNDEITKAAQTALRADSLDRCPEGC